MTMRHLAMIPAQAIALALVLSGCALFQKEGGRSGVTGPAEPQTATEFAPAVSTSVLGTTQAASAEALVKDKAQGRIVTAAGTSLAVELRPGTGGALLSLAAFQALGLSLTQLPQVTVYGP
jgi:hypothetical protein